MTHRNVRLARTVARNWWQRQAYRFMKIEPRKYGNAVIVLDMLCNSSCGMCSSWAKATPPGTLTAAQWAGVVDKLKAHNPDIKISFVGGEPLLVHGLTDLLRHTRDAGVSFSLVTNGILLTQEKIDELLALEPLALHVSFDSLRPNIYKRMRGVDETTTVQGNIRLLAQSAATTSTHVGLKATVTNLNLPEVNDIADFADEVGMSIHYQPVLADNKVASARMKIDPVILDQQVGMLTDRIAKQKGATNIANTPAHLSRWRSYYDGSETERSFCPTGIENLFIGHDGAVKLCERYSETVGNVLTDSIASIINSDAARKLRATTFSCKRNCTFIYQRGPADYWRIFRVMMTKTRSRVTA